VQCVFSAGAIRLTWGVSFLYLLTALFPLADLSPTRPYGLALACSQTETGARDSPCEEPSCLSDSAGNQERQESKQLRTLGSTPDCWIFQRPRTGVQLSRAASPPILSSVRFWIPRKLLPPTAADEPPLPVPA